VHLHAFEIEGNDQNGPLHGGEEHMAGGQVAAEGSVLHHHLLITGLHVLDHHPRALGLAAGTHGREEEAATTVQDLGPLVHVVRREIHGSHGLQWTSPLGHALNASDAGESHVAVFPPVRPQEPAIRKGRDLRYRTPLQRYLLDGQVLGKP
jgi:hypothetical protein